MPWLRTARTAILVILTTLATTTNICLAQDEICFPDTDGESMDNLQSCDYGYQSLTWRIKDHMPHNCSQSGPKSSEWPSPEKQSLGFPPRSTAPQPSNLPVKRVLHILASCTEPNVDTLFSYHTCCENACCYRLRFWVVPACIASVGFAAGAFFALCFQCR